MTVWVPPVGEYAGFSTSNIDRAIEAGLTFRPLTDTVLATTGEAAAARVFELAEGGVDVALECVGKPETVATGASWVLFYMPSDSNRRRGSSGRHPSRPTPHPVISKR